MGLIAKIREEGIRQGVLQGMQQGVRQGLRQGESLLLRRLLTQRFGILPAWTEKRLAEAEPEQLELWGGRILEVETLEKLFEDE